jgi:siroheme synthase-like protein
MSKTANSPSGEVTGARENSTRAPLLPLFANLTGRPVLLVGGGKVASAKLDALLAAGAVVAVVAPEILPALDRTGVTLKQRAFEASDLDGMWLVITAAPPEVNRAVWTAAEARQIFVNAADDVASGSAYLGAVIRRGATTVAISTDGQAPALAALVRQAIESLLPDDLEEWLDEAKRIRAQWKADKVAMGERRPLLLRALNRLYSPREESR